MNVRETLASIADAITALNDHLTGADIKRAEAQSSAVALQRAHKRVANLRAGFREICSRSAAVSETVHEFERQRA